MSRRDKMIAKIKELMYEPDQIRNIGICAHIDHGKTTLSDNLLAGAGMISEELAGDQRFLDFDEQEQARGITIDAANVSMVHDYKDSEYLINLIDTPGHVDFGGDVTRAMRAVDGAVVVVCAVEGIMPQTETVFRQALKENVKPVLFINKVDRLINELKLEPEELQNRFLKIFMEANKLIKNMAPEDKREEWKLDFTDGSVAFGSAYHNWAINVPTMQETGINFKDIIDYCNAENEKELAQKVPLSDVLLGMVVEHLPSPKVAQEYRVPNIWDGDIDSPAGQCMVNTSPDGPLAVMVTNVSVDKHAGEIATGRVYGGAIEKGTEVYLVGSHGKSRVQQVGVYFGPERVNTDKVPAGNIVYVAGAKGAIAGETLCSPEDKIKELIPYVIIVIAVVLIRTFLVTPIKVNGTSMYDTLKGNDIYFDIYNYDKKELIIPSKIDGIEIKRITGFHISNVKTIKIEYGIEEIMNYCFVGAYNLEKLYVPKSVTKMGKGILVSQTVDGNIILGPTSEEMENPTTETTPEGLQRVIAKAGEMVKSVPLYNTITSFTGVRAYSTKHDFIIEESKTVEGLINCAGIESPGLTSAPAIAKYLVEEEIKTLLKQIESEKNYISVDLKFILC